MDIINNSAKLFEDISAKKDPHFESAVKAIVLVKEFIRKKKLIIYGGTAIDFALRLHGDNIYPDETLLIPDLDFYSPRNVEDAYELADILFDAGFPDARTIKATHTRTMRVDIADNHFIADLSYVEPAIFSELPFIEYDGMRIVHPNYQKIDLHSSLNFPFDNPPKEVIFARWTKDIFRYNKLSQYYPVHADDSVKKSMSRVTLTYDGEYLLDGCAAYSVIYAAYCDLRDNYARADFTEEEPIAIKPDFSVDDNGKIATEIISDLAQSINYIADSIPSRLPRDAKYFSRYLDIIPKHIEYSHKDTNYYLKIIDKRLISYYVVGVGSADIKVVGVQYLLLHFLLMSYVDSEDAGKKQSHLLYYVSLLRIIKNAEIIIAGIADSAERNEIILNSPFFPTVNVFGKCNMSETYESSLLNTFKNIAGKCPENAEKIKCSVPSQGVSAESSREPSAETSDLARTAAEVSQNIATYSELIKLPANYYPGRGREKTQFKYDESIYYIRDQREVDKNLFRYL